jgi:hypothetical protein
MTKITRGFEADGDRYRYDFGPCNFKHGWAQLDTSQDAWYYGNWINPLTLKLFSYVEGDTTLTECENEAEFVAAVREYCQWHKEHGWWTESSGIDGMCSEPIIEAFTRMGLAEFLH